MKVFISEFKQAMFNLGVARSQTLQYNYADDYYGDQAAVVRRPL